MLLRLVTGGVLVFGIAVGGAAFADAQKPVVVTGKVANGDPMEWPGAKSERDGDVVNAPISRSDDNKSFAGLYKAGPSRMEFQSYPVDEFMYFLEGSVTLTSADGTVRKISAGDSASIPKGWRGTWETSGYVKYYVVYVGDASPTNQEKGEGK